MDNREQKNSQKQKKTQKHKNNYTLSTITMVVSRFGVRIIVYSLLAILFYYGITKAYDLGYQAFTVKAVDSGEGTEILVNIRKGMTKEEIASLLVSKGLVEDKNTFLVQTALYTSDRYPIQPGSYTLNTAQTPEEMLAVMTVQPETEEETTALALHRETESESDGSEETAAEESAAASTEGMANGQ